MAGALVRFAVDGDSGWPCLEPEEGTARVFDRVSRDVPGLDDDLWRAWTAA